MANARNVNFDPNSLAPAGPSERQVYGVSSGPDTAEYLDKQPLRAPDGRTYVKIQYIGSDGQPRGVPDYVTKGPTGQPVRITNTGNGWVEADAMGSQGFFKDILSDKNLMTVLAIAGAGAAAGSAWGAGNAGITAGTGATPGTAGAIPSAAGNGVAGLGAAGPGVIGTMGGPGNQSVNPVGSDAAANYSDAGMPNYGGGGEGGFGMGDAAAGAAQGSFWSRVGDWLTGGGQGGIDGIFDAIGGLGNAAQGAGSLALMYKMYEDNKDNAQEWRNWMEEGTPDLGFYQGKLKQSYEDPGAWLQGPEYQAAQNVVHNKLQRNDAAGGNLANNFGRQVQLQDHAMGALGDYRQGLGGLVNQQQQTRAGIGGALENAQAAEGDWMKNLMNWLNSQGN